MTLENSRINVGAGNGKSSSLDLKSITKIKREISNFKTTISLQRPVNRITIYGVEGGGNKMLDISLKHFLIKDVRQLLLKISKERPDLEIPII